MIAVCMSHQIQEYFCYMIANDTKCSIWLHLNTIDVAAKPLAPFSNMI